MKKTFTFFVILTMLSGVLMAQVRGPKSALAPTLKQGLSELHSAEAAELAGRFMAAERLFAKTMQQKSLAATMKLDSITYEDNILPAKSWEFLWRDIFRYDTQNRVNEILELEWDDDSGTIVTEWRTTINYNAQGRIAEMAFFGFEEGEMKMSSRMEFYWDGAGRVDSIVDYSEGWESGEMELSGYQKYVYGTNGRVAHISMYDYDEFEEAYLEVMRRVFTYNAAGQRTMSQTIIIDEGEEMVFSQSELFYNASGRLVASEYSGMSFASFPDILFEKRNRSEYDYDGDGDQTESRWLRRIGETWVLEDRDVTAYHATVKAAGVIMPFAVMSTLYEADMDISLNFVKLPMGSTTYTTEDGAERTDSRSLFHYTGLSNTQVSETPEYAFRMYPNPVAGQLQLDWHIGYDQLTLEVYHITGARILQQTITANQAVDTQTLRSGMYLYRVSDKEQVVYSGKFIKR